MSRVLVPVIPSPPAPLQYNPSDIVGELEREANILKGLRAKISDQLTRLQVEEVVLRKQMDSVLLKHKQQQQPTITSTNHPQLSTDTNHHHFDLADDHDLTSLQSKPDAQQDNEEDVLDDDEATVQMRHILETELGQSYNKE
jgi:hypothetical protein